jgi:GLPGLI family protein
MQKIAAAACFSLLTFLGQAQQKEGKVMYERTIQMQMSFAGMNDEMQRMIPRSRTDKFELVFGNNKSLWKAAEQDNEDESMTGDNGGGMQIRVVTAGANDVLYSNFESGTRLEQR